MIGDWMDWPKSPFANPHFYSQVVALDSGIFPCIGILLTPEILEKNGFKDAPAKDTDVHNLVGKWWHKSGDVYAKKYCLSHGTYAYTIGFHPYTRIENIHNVHELQHALRLCGLDELADNFKV